MVMMMICKVCKRYFNAKKEIKYTVVKITGGLRVLTDETKVYECFDCPKCGCQNIVNIREGVVPGEVKDED